MKYEGRRIDFLECLLVRTLNWDEIEIENEIENLIIENQAVKMAVDLAANGD
ncbi:MAG: hypothetical protein WBA61_11445 [Aequorivita sp.]